MAGTGSREQSPLFFSLQDTPKSDKGDKALEVEVDGLKEQIDLLKDERDNLRRQLEDEKAERRNLTQALLPAPEKPRERLGWISGAFAKIGL